MNRNTKLQITMWSLLLLVILISAVLTIPSIIRSIQAIKMDTGDFRTAAESDQSDESDEALKAQTVFRPLIRFTDNSFILEMQGLSRTEIEALPQDRIDAALLSLTFPPTEEEIGSGLFSAIPSDADYLGSQIVRGTIYVSFSKELIEEHPLGDDGIQLAYLQILHSLQPFTAINSVIILIDKTITHGPIPLDSPLPKTRPPLSEN